MLISMMTERGRIWATISRVSTGERPRRRGAADAGADDHYLGRRHADGAPEKDSASALVVLQDARGNLRHHQPADLAQRGVHRALAALQLDLLVGQDGETLPEHNPDLVLPTIS